MFQPVITDFKAIVSQATYDQLTPQDLAELLKEGHIAIVENERVVKVIKRVKEK